MEDDFLYYCANGKLQEAMFVYENYNINATVDNNYALYMACAKGHIKIVKYLFSITSVKKIIASGNIDRVIIWSCANGRFDIVRFLCENLPYQHIIKNIRDALYWCCLKGHTDILLYLCQILDFETINANNVLFYACYYGYNEIVMYLCIRYDLYNSDIICKNTSSVSI